MCIRDRLRQDVVNFLAGIKRGSSSLLGNRDFLGYFAGVDDMVDAGDPDIIGGDTAHGMDSGLKNECAIVRITVNCVK